MVSKILKDVTIKLVCFSVGATPGLQNLMIDDESHRGTVSDIPDDLQRDSVNSILNSKNMYKYKAKKQGIGS